MSNSHYFNVLFLVLIFYVLNYMLILIIKNSFPKKPAPIMISAQTAQTNR